MSTPVQGFALRPTFDDLGRVAGSLFGKRDDGQRLAAENLALRREMELLQARLAQVESLVDTDELTGLLNKRGFAGGLTRALAAARRHGDAGVLAYFDVDDFKRVNDTWGHQAGDRVLQGIGQLLGSNVRSCDLVARLHGDEFAVVLVRSTVKHGLEKIAALEAKLNCASIPFADIRIPVRVSVGAVPYGGNMDLHATLDAAEKAMYARKGPSSRAAA